MNKAILLFIVAIFLSNCASHKRLGDYFGQDYPDTIPLIFAPDIISQQGRLEHGISFTPDERELAFGVLGKNDLRGEIFYSKKVNEKWSEPQVFELLKDRSVYLPYFSPDGETLIYAQSTSDTDNFNTDLWMVRKVNDVWSAPKLLYDPINSESRESNGSIASNGTIYFSSNRNCNGEENCHTADLFYCERTDDRNQDINVISELSSSNDEESVFISPKEDYLIFCRYRDDETAVDLYISYRDIHKNWIAPQRIDSTINSNQWERRPYVSIDNKFLFFTRLRIGEMEIDESDIFWVNTSKLFKPFVFNPILDTTLQVGTEFEISLPVDYFKDIDDKELMYSIHQGNPDWVKFDSKQLKLSGVPPMEGEFELILTAYDSSSNSTDSIIRVFVKK